MLTSLFSLALVLALLAGLVWWVRRSGPLARRGGRHIEILETVALGPGHSLHLVRLGTRALLLAAGRERCELVCEVEAPAAPSAAEVSWAEALRARQGRS